MPLPAIFAAISAAASLFETSKKVYETVTNTPVRATTPEALQVEVEALPGADRAIWLQRMETYVDEHRAETERLKVEQGEVTADLLRVLTPAAAAAVALERMTTRPRIVRWCAHVILLPVYVTAADMGFMFFNGLARAFGAEPMFNLFAEKIFGDGSIYVTMYTWAAPTASMVLMTYIGARTVEKVRNGGTDSLSGLVGKVTGAIGAIKGLVKR